MRIKYYSLVFCFLVLIPTLRSQEESVARVWNEIVLESIRLDLARPTVHGRNLYHVSAAMYDAWSVFSDEARPFFLGNNVGGYEVPFDGFSPSDDIESARHEAISYAAYRLITWRYRFSSNFGLIRINLNNQMNDFGYSIFNTSLDYSTGDPAALGNYIADQIIKYGQQDGANEPFYDNLYYSPVNSPITVDMPGNPTIQDLNRWQPIRIETGFVDQSGNPLSSTPGFLSPEWGNVTPFAMTGDDLTILTRDGNEWWTYHDPSDPPYLDIINGGPMSEEYQWGYAMVCVWSGHCKAEDDLMIDISPGAQGNQTNLPQSIEEYRDFYLMEGGDPSTGRDLNPTTGLPYEPNIVPRGDYVRVLSEFWADGPSSETPPGHWFTLLNYVSDNPELTKKYRGLIDVEDDLEWDIKSYFILGGAMHDCAVSAWGVKGYYDYVRPVSAIRGMAELGQSSDPSLPNYHIGGLPLIENHIELVTMGDSLAGPNNENLNKVKLFSWKGPDYISNPDNDAAGVGWILAENWWPYQRPSFVSPNFAGYVSGHSTFSRAAAEVLTLFTGDEYFPGGMGEFIAPQNDFLVFEEGPSQDITLQWATYRDASDQTSLSRIWGGIHPPADDIPGRLMGIKIGVSAFEYAESFFYQDKDNDGFYSFEDCNDDDANINPSMPETCDGVDNNCDGFNNEDLSYISYYLDQDQDGFGDVSIVLDTCLSTPPMGYVANSLDCADDDDAQNPNIAELCDKIDNNCNGLLNDGIPFYTYFFDFDNDGFGDQNISLDTCIIDPPMGYVANSLDCDDNIIDINPDVVEICDKIDNDCDGFNNNGLTYFTYYFDFDNDGFGDEFNRLDTCIALPPMGYVVNSLDCDDNIIDINPDVIEICDKIDNDCDGFINNGLTYFTYYFDFDNDGFGDEFNSLDTCIATPPSGFVALMGDCNDDSANEYPGAPEIADNNIDEDCSGKDLFEEIKYFPNPIRDELLVIHYQIEGEVEIFIYNNLKETVLSQTVQFDAFETTIDVSRLHTGSYILYFKDGKEDVVTRIIKL